MSVLFERSIIEQLRESLDLAYSELYDELAKYESDQAQFGQPFIKLNKIAIDMKIGNLSVVAKEIKKLKAHDPRKIK